MLCFNFQHQDWYLHVWWVVFNNCSSGVSTMPTVKPTRSCALRGDKYLMKSASGNFHCKSISTSSSVGGFLFNYTLNGRAHSKHPYHPAFWCEQIAYAGVVCLTSRSIIPQRWYAVKTRYSFPGVSDRRSMDRWREQVVSASAPIL